MPIKIALSLLTLVLCTGCIEDSENTAPKKAFYHNCTSDIGDTAVLRYNIKDWHPAGAVLYPTGTRDQIPLYSPGKTTLLYGIAMHSAAWVYLDTSTNFATFYVSRVGVCEIYDVATSTNGLRQ